MLKFFRNLPAGQAGIRQKFLQQNRITQYLVYALGEIFFVVIGILIALQINTWNENRKLDQQEKSYLNRLIQENKSDILTFTAEIERLEMNNEKIANLSLAFKNEEVVIPFWSTVQVNL